MKQFKKISMLVAAALFIVAGLSSCGGSDDDKTTVDLTTLNSVVDSCTTVLNSATTAEYPQTAITTFQTTLSSVKSAIADSGSLNQAAVNNLIAQLRVAAGTFAESAYDAIPADALTFALSFDEGTGTSLTTTGKYKWTANLEKGPSEIFGTNTNYPSFIDGKVGKAMYFSNGSHIEISDYSAAPLEGSKLSLACWVRPDSTRAGNYIISYNYWNSWKFNLQTENKPFFTVKTATGCTDMDNELDNSVPNKQWTFVVVSMDLTAGTVDFYINGSLTKEWTATEHTALTGSIASYSTKLPLLIGVCTTYAEASAWSWFSKDVQAWDSYIGAIDELQVYNIALSAGQVTKLYKDETAE
ncbi:MAG: LamG domain-containing protein [Bacteroidales bacterium]|jgi:hypothetical protein|nr:LamG domain-containing protein [Bacteroidales bacterium]MCI1784750.1 LamG domain-containing protein [Bacteroidales bacterium]